MASEYEQLADPVRCTEDAPADAPQFSAPEGAWLVGTLAGFTEQGAPEVSVVVDGQRCSLVTLPALPVSRADLGRQAVVKNATGEVTTPLLMGFVHTPLELTLEAGQGDRSEPRSRQAQAMSVEVDDAPARDLVMEGQEKLVLRCGSASITLTEAGKIILRGRHLVSRSEGVNRILGASIQMN
ncbi:MULTISPECIES: hypothetical protein [Marinimicrobium]|uniref:Uncharacterized protein n=1 Tax=Marinimicrobium koreense TaxID=306545 RepID=A0A3N1NRI3_9GAMM|nr:MULTISPECIES: hypothetical protein [Marinimicrobium]ROQ18499.1 hypothetical protein EDC38_2726 [Marinimicrobium koreense]